MRNESQDNFVSCADIAMDDIIPSDREAEFLQHMMDNGLWKPRFKVEPFYESRTDCTLVYFEDTPSYGVPLSPDVTVMKAADDNRIIGVDLRGKIQTTGGGNAK